MSNAEEAADADTVEHAVEIALLNLPEVGRRLRAARIMAGFKRVQDASETLEARYGVVVSPRTIYAIERGEQQATGWGLFLALTLLYRPPGGVGFFLPAVREDVRAEVNRMYETYQGSL